MNANYAVVGWTDKTSVGDEVSVEVDVRSADAAERTVRFFINNVEQKYYIYGVPAGVRVGVCSFLVS